MAYITYSYSIISIRVVKEIFFCDKTVYIYITYWHNVYVYFSNINILTLIEVCNVKIYMLFEQFLN